MCILLMLLHVKSSSPVLIKDLALMRKGLCRGVKVLQSKTSHHNNGVMQLQHTVISRREVARRLIKIINTRKNAFFASE